ncbi:hypothetical protein B5E58_05640 [Tyzzerella sp. An114]|uniref:DUF2085 domain-containing protein n=1 Tax=Tyzzerella sp. An114 TaxID=1965545 RepID=UPI000B4489FC|nr:DUF2085 domain-containing protein [Tyzzerella sp. An114]OUQ59257.1 hypothetical protein B5E58_05640 [Tyzzerella sp. An114]
MRDKIYKWLPIIFGCHKRADRSFFHKGKQFPICARCTGELVGMILSAFLFYIYIPPLNFCILIMVPMIIDGFLQSLTKYESNNILRFITGFMFGYGLISLFIKSNIIVAKYGYNIGKNLI